ncbi:nuclear transport factor 2 family protein [Jongsikchunia kroppenstedtii]|uniref:nuclear transport factor 2 family protein n=1 Tax=Jongsikchunia kroppenstedtii TaxID=1121721 RepID=UPI00036B451C|nr:nuclear transport factor 2 family protein [Jongsikchunia kroppenstedtii]
MSNYEDEREIYRNIVLIARAMDDRDWAAIDPLVDADMTADLGTGPVTSRADMVAIIRSYLDDCGPTQHLVANVLIDVDGDTATSRAYVSDMHLGTGELEGQFFRTLGDYHDDWRRTPDGWRMTRRVKHNRGALGNYAVMGSGPQNWTAPTE